MSALGAQTYFVIPLSVQKEGEDYLVGNPDIGDFYKFPQEGLLILNRLKSGDTASMIKSGLAAEVRDQVNVDEFLDQLTSIGFIYPEDQRSAAQEWLRTRTGDTRRTFDVDPRLAKAIFSTPVLLCCLGVILYAVISAAIDPNLRVNFNAFYIETNRTLLLLLVLSLSCVQIVLHESGHMLAAARHGVKSRYGIGTRLWTIVAESDLTGILALPKVQRYFPMLAGLLVDIVCGSIATILIKIMLQRGASPFAIQVAQALVLETVISIIWQFNIFIKTDIYYVICNYLSHPDLDRDARIYLFDVLHRITFGRFGRKATMNIDNVLVLRLFSAIWLLGRIMSLFVLFFVFIPTMGKYIMSAAELFSGPPASVWQACDTILYVSITMTMMSIGMYMWLKQKHINSTEKGEVSEPRT
jgi:putative peptide zinc metalloprotease protein